MIDSVVVIHRSIFHSSHDKQVRPNDPVAHRRKVDEVKLIVDQEMGFVPISPSSDDNIATRDKRFYLYISSKNKIIGLCIAEHIKSAYALFSTLDHVPTENEEAKNGLNTAFNASFMRSDKPCRATLGIYQIWTHCNHRRKGIGGSLVDAVRSSIVFGTRVQLPQIAFSSPTADGIRFATEYCGTTNVLVYDC